MNLQANINLQFSYSYCICRTMPFSLNRDSFVLNHLDCPAYDGGASITNYNVQMKAAVNEGIVMKILRIFTVKLGHIVYCFAGY